MSNIYSIFVSNFNFLILKAAGCVAACIGIWFRIDRDFTTLIQRIGESDISLKSAEIYLGANLLISVGCIIAFIGLLGSISISKENNFLLFVYAGLMFCVFGLYVTCAIWGFVRLDYVFKILLCNNKYIKLVISLFNLFS